MNEFIMENEKIYVNVPYAEAYIAKELFDREGDDETKSSIAMQYADGFKLMGLFNMRFFDSDDEERDSRPIQTFAFPNMIMSYPTESSTAKLKLRNIGDFENYMVLHYYMGDVMMEMDVEDTSNCTKMMKMITMGKIPNTIPYDKFTETWATNFSVNGFNPQVPAVVLQMIWAEMCRDPHDLTKPYRYIWGKGGADPTGYISTNMNNVASATSVFSALSFERITEKMATSLNMTRSGKEQRRSPIEAVLSM